MDESISRNLHQAKSQDKFYTCPKVVAKFMNRISTYFGHDIHVIEPSAGDGAFIDAIKTNYRTNQFFDLYPEHPAVQKMDFLNPDQIIPSNSLFIGNPPFGKNSSLAVKFFNQCAKSSPVGICMIHPKTFMKPRFWSRLDDRYTLVEQFELPKDSFILNGTSYDVPCVAQIWVKKRRIDDLPKELTLFTNIGKGHVFIRRAGYGAGTIVQEYTPSSTYRVDCSYDTLDKLNEFKDDIRYIASLTAGVRSITLHEIEDVLFGRYEPCYNSDI